MGIQQEKVMFAVIYRFKLKPQQEKSYEQYWRTIVNYFVKHRGAIGCCLHKGEDGLWVAYSRWPDKATRDAAWPGEQEPDENLPIEIKETICQMQAIRQENQDLEQYDELCLEVVDDLLLN